jgi:hypothetical protein
MSLDPYRTLSPRVVPSSGPRVRPALDLVVVLGLLWALALVRVLAALARAEAASAELNLAWLAVILVPIAIGSEIAAVRRGRR